MNYVEALKICIKAGEGGETLKHSAVDCLAYIPVYLKA